MSDSQETLHTTLSSYKRYKTGKVPRSTKSSRKRKLLYSAVGHKAKKHQADIGTGPMNEEAGNEPVVVSEENEANQLPIAEGMNLPETFKFFEYINTSNENHVLTMEQKVHLVLAFALRFQVPNIGLEYLLKMFNLFHPNSLPNSKYMIDKFSNLKKHVERHYFCFKCELYLGLSVPVKCPLEECNVELNEKDLLKKNSYSLYFPLKYSLPQLLENSQIKIETKCKNRPCSNDNKIRDVNDGSAYKSLHKDHDLETHCISLGISWDGVAVSKSSSSQIHPIQIKVLELEPKLRDKYIMLPSLYFGGKKPPVNPIWVPFVEELKELHNKGLTIIKDGKSINVLVVPAFAAMDAIARAYARNAMQFNGGFGCDFCEHPGKSCYPFLGFDAELRDDDLYPHESRLGTFDKPHKGYKGVSILASIPNFKMITSFTPEYQHGSCLGVMKTLWQYFVSPKFKGKPWFIGNSVPEISNLFKLIKPPNEVSRTTRDLNLYKRFKSNEWRAHIFFYLIPLLKGFLPKKYYDNFCLFASSIYILCQQEITHEEVNHCELALKKFVVQFSDLYEDEMTTYNIHCLTHVPKAVRDWGPLWVTSTYPFESFNMFLVKNFNGSLHVSEQIMEKTQLWSHIKLKTHLFDSCNTPIKQLFTNLTSTLKTPANKVYMSANLRLLGYPRKVTLSADDNATLKVVLGTKIKDENSLEFDSCILNGVFISNKNNYKQNDCILVRERDYYKFINVIVVKACKCVEKCDNCLPIPIIQCVPFTTKPFKHFEDLDINFHANQFVEAKLLDGTMSFFPIKIDKLRKCVCLNIHEKTFLVALPNNVESD